MSEQPEALRLAGWLEDDMPPLPQGTEFHSMDKDPASDGFMPFKVSPLKTWFTADQMQAYALEALRAQAASVEPTHWRAVLANEQREQQLRTDLHIVLFRDKRSAESWIASKEDFTGWRYTLEPLYASAPPSPTNRQGDKVIPTSLPLAAEIWTCQGEIDACRYDGMLGEFDTDHTQGNAHFDIGYVRLDTATARESALIAERDALRAEVAELMRVALQAAPTPVAAVPALVPLTEEQMISAVRPLCNTDQVAERLVAVSIDEYRAIEAASAMRNGLTVGDGGEKE